MPDENIGKNLEEMCIRRGNLKYLDDEIVNANLKKQTPKLFTVMDAILFLHLDSHLAGYIPRFGAICYLHSMVVDRLEQDFINELKRKKSSVMLPKMQVRWWDLLVAVMNDMVMISTMVKFAHCVC